MILWLFHFFSLIFFKNFLRGHLSDSLSLPDYVRKLWAAVSGWGTQLRSGGFSVLAPVWAKTRWTVHMRSLPVTPEEKSALEDATRREEIC